MQISAAVEAAIANLSTSIKRRKLRDRNIVTRNTVAFVSESFLGTSHCPATLARLQSPRDPTATRVLNARQARGVWVRRLMTR